MTHFDFIVNKLERFIKKYHINALIKGCILFFTIGVLYFLLVLLIEHFLWLNTSLRTVLFWLFIGVELALFVKFIVIPLAKLFKLQKGIDYKTASKIIGNYFPEVNDKLINVLQLKTSSEQSELLLASIEQKAIDLKPVPFKLAINLKKNIKYLKYALIPFFIFCLVAISGHISWFSDSYTRVVNYTIAYEPPAPFTFYVLNESLEATEGEPFTLFIETQGSVIPEQAQIKFNNETYFLKTKGLGVFEYEFENPKHALEFRLHANSIRSKPYNLKIVQVPTLLGFDMVLNYPNYTKRSNDILKSTGNATVPEGTKVTWNLKTKSTNKVSIYTQLDTLLLQSKTTLFKGSKRVFRPLEYTISTSNSSIKNYESLSYSIRVIKDEYPELDINIKVDSIDNQTLYFKGKASDDYGLTKLQLVYYPNDNEQDAKIIDLPVGKNSNFQEFITAFPNTLDLPEGIPYTLYLQVFDNDGVNTNKRTKSRLFNYRKRTKQEEEKKQLNNQSETIKNIDRSLNTFKKNQKELEALSKLQKEKPNLNFNDRKKIESFIKRQQQQEQLMKQFNKQLKDNLENFQKKSSKKDPYKEALKERLKLNEEQLKRDEKLLEELAKLKDKIKKEELTQKIDKLTKQSKNKERSLKQLLELTKRFYVTKKLERLAQDLEKLAQAQAKLSKTDTSKHTKSKQDSINKSFDNFTKALDSLQKENKQLTDPFKIPQDKRLEKQVKDEQQKATEALNKQEQSKNQEDKKVQQKAAKASQNKAAEKMKDMGAKMQASMQASGKESLDEDIEMLRQIIDNLIVFSFDEEDLMHNFKRIEVNHNAYASYLKQQKNLRSHFEHIDDSLFALSLRQPKISEKINKEISSVFSNIDSALDKLSENNLYQGIASMQYVMTHANNLANELSSSLDGMKKSGGVGGSGKPSDGPPMDDIIISQQALKERFKQGMKAGRGKAGKTGKEGKPGETGKPSSGKKGNSGESGSTGSNGNTQGKGNAKSGFSDDPYGELYKIYQHQQQLRNALEERLDKLGTGQNGQAKQLLKSMEEVELDLINKGFTNQVLTKMSNLQHQLLKLKNATFLQGEDTKRESKSNTNIFNNTTQNKLPIAKQYFNSTEILNKQSLPLQPIYKKKVQDYFKNND